MGRQRNRASLPDALTALGMGDAFCSSQAADFSGIGPGYCMSDVEHKAVVKVDEIGTVVVSGHFDRVPLHAGARARIHNDDGSPVPLRHS
jgi:serine protease inhibitor